MKNNWNLKNTNNINQMLRVRDDIDLSHVAHNFPHLVIIKHNFHIADDIMFPDPACLSFFTAFENNHLEVLEKDKKLILCAVNIFEGLIEFFIYCNEVENTVYDCIHFLKSNDLYKCEFEIINNDKTKRLSRLT